MLMSAAVPLSAVIFLNVVNDSGLSSSHQRLVERERRIANRATILAVSIHPVA